MRYLDVPYFKQDTGYTCGPTSLQMVLAYHGIRESEAALAKELETDPQNGTYHHNMIEGALRRKLHCYVNDNATLPELRYLIDFDAPVIVHFLEMPEREDHYSVVVGLSDKHVLLNDPWSGERVRLTHMEFFNNWTCDALGRCKQWLMAVTKDPLPLGRQYQPHASHGKKR
jgi:predicted double-glycine peptidase